MDYVTLFLTMSPRMFQDASKFFATNKDLLTLCGAAIGGGLALLRYWLDQSWHKKQFAYDYAEGVFGDAKSMAALRMLDWDNGSIPVAVAREFGLANNDREWTRDEVCEALRLHDASTKPFSQKEYVIRELFDACLARFERLGHLMESGIISANDFPTTLAYYPEIMVEERSEKLRQPLEAYMKRYKFDYARRLFEALANRASKLPAVSGGRGMSVGLTKPAAMTSTPEASRSTG